MAAVEEVAGDYGAATAMEGVAGGGDTDTAPRGLVGWLAPEDPNGEPVWIGGEDAEFSDGEEPQEEEEADEGGAGMGGESGDEGEGRESMPMLSEVAAGVNATLLNAVHDELMLAKEVQERLHIDLGEDYDLVRYSEPMDDARWEVFQRGSSYKAYSKKWDEVGLILQFNSNTAIH